MNLEQELNILLGQSENSGFFNAVQSFNKKLDKYFGITSVESKLNANDEDIYVGINMEALSTSYLDYYKMLKDLGKGKVLVDLGAGYCRGTFLAKKLNLYCKSVELNRLRASKAKLKYPDDVFIHDIKLNQLVDGDAYFMYLPWSELSNEILSKIYNLNIIKEFYIIESHGDFIKNLTIYKEFELLDESQTVSSLRHDSKIYKYRFNPSDRFKKIDISDFKNKELIPLWFLKYRDKVKSITIETSIPNGKVIQWSCELRNSYCCYYGGQISLFIFSKSRYLQYQFDTIIDIEQLKPE